MEGFKCEGCSSGTTDPKKSTTEKAICAYCGNEYMKEDKNTTINVEGNPKFVQIAAHIYNIDKIEKATFN